MNSLSYSYNLFDMTTDFDNKFNSFGDIDANPFLEQEQVCYPFEFEEKCNEVPQKDFFKERDFQQEKSLDSCSFIAQEDFRSCFDPEINDDIRDFNVFRTVSTKGRSNWSVKDNCPPSTGNKADVTGTPVITGSTAQTPIASKRCDINVDLLGYINDAIENGLKIPSLTAGRPKQEFDTSSERLLKFYDEYTSGLQYLIQTNFSKKRSDTFRNTIFSYLKKLPIKLREICCSVSEPKSKKMEVFLDAFLSPFITWFLPYVPAGNAGYSKLDLFLYFIWICYPEEKVKRIINTLVQQNSLSLEKAEVFLNTLSLRKGKSKKEMWRFISSNPCFQIYSSHICHQLKCHNFDEQAALMVKDFI